MLRWLAEMSNADHLHILAKGVELWNEWRSDTHGHTVDLSHADLRALEFRGINLKGANLAGTNFTGARLTSAELGGARLSGATLIEVDLRMARLKGAEMTGAQLIGADLGGADLKNAELSGADLSGAYVRGTRLDGTRLSGARLRGTTFAEVDLSGSIGLEAVEHKGPSTIGLDTIYRSKGQIPESFLRGCGVPENFISYMKSLTGAALDFYSCFISYSSRDQAFADRLYADLRARGIRCWFAPHDIQGGRKIHEQIDEAIRLYDKLLLVLSDASMNSEWVITEISKARKCERQEKRRMLFPISIVPYDAVRDWECFDADAGKDSAREVREYYIPDFSHWKEHDSYSRAFDRLVYDLKAPPGAKPLIEAGP